MEKMDVGVIVVYHSLTRYPHSRLYEHKRTIEYRVQINRPQTFSPDFYEIRESII